jgi:hypothetical protein
MGPWQRLQEMIIADVERNSFGCQTLYRYSNKEDRMNSIRSLKSYGRWFIPKILFLSLALMLSLGVTQARAQAITFTVNIIEPVDLFVYVPCAAGGAGEFVQLSGSLHTVIVTTLDDQGGYHIMFHNQPQGISGTGETTGDMYHGVGETLGTFNGKLGVETTFVNNFKIVGPGPGNNLMYHETFHMTVLADGRLTSYVDNIGIECR